MIPNTTSWSAVYDKNGAHVTQRIIAWDSDGFALIVDAINGTLQRAADQPHFLRLQVDYDVAAQYVAALPGGGWTVEFSGVDGTTESIPVVAWGVSPEGAVTPLINGTNEACPVPQTLQPWMLVAPSTAG